MSEKTKEFVDALEDALKGCKIIRHSISLEKDIARFSSAGGFAQASKTGKKTLTLEIEFFDTDEFNEFCKKQIENDPYAIEFNEFCKKQIENDPYATVRWEA